MKEVVREVPRDVIVEKRVVKTVEVEVEKPIIKEVIKEVPRDVIVEREVVKTVEVVVTPTPIPPASTPTPHPLTRLVSDDTGRGVEIPYRPKRVAVTNAWMVETLMACDYTPVAHPLLYPAPDGGR